MSLREDIISVLSDLVKFDTSINPERGIYPSSECAQFIEEYGKNNGYLILDMSGCKIVKDEQKISDVFPVVLYKNGMNPGPTVLFLGHIDVVPVTKAELETWETSPFDPVVKDGWLYGRGAGDMKGGVAAFLLAFKDLKIEKGNLVIALSGDEEIGGMGSMPELINRLEKNDLRPDFVINAEGAEEEAIVTKRRGGTQIEFEFDLNYKKINGVLKNKSFESVHGDDSESLHSMSFILGADIHAMISAGKFSMERKIVHATSSSTKSNAAPKIVKIQYVDTSSKKEDHSKLEYSQGLTNLFNSLTSIGSINWPIVPSKYGPSVCPNLLQVDKNSNKGTVTFDIRSMLIDTKSHEIMVQRLQEHFSFFNLETKANVSLALDTVNVDPNGSFPQKLLEIANQEGFNISTIGEKLGGGSDTRFFTSIGIPGIELGPLEKNGHGTNEAVDLSYIEKLIPTYQRMFEYLVSS